MLRRWFGKEARIFEWVCAVGGTLWGLWLFDPSISFDRPAYALLYLLAPKVFYAVAIFLAGMAQALAIWHEDRKWREYAAFMQTGVWFFVALALGLYNFHSTALISYLWIATFHLVVWQRLAVNPK